eukprot:TRINITY_DN17482_c0_g1_i1.p1 TRINITY_DN17482_c0_g1~~TRINITY_DN17482_c0_g1_i1.p1  ORF type:complete len:103 (+),score=25.27 TRINITY_DN17482_c0_g1_i1:88-396(+)
MEKKNTEKGSKYTKKNEKGTKRKKSSDDKNSFDLGSEKKINEDEITEEHRKKLQIFLKKMNASIDKNLSEHKPLKIKDKYSNKENVFFHNFGRLNKIKFSEI